MRDTFLSYKNYSWMWTSLLAVLVLTVIYLIDSPIGGPSGGTFLGYTYGIISTAGIVYLMWYAKRRRAYFSSKTTLKGMLSAHVWIGLSLTIIVPLHSGFSFGINVHTLTYVFMVLTIATGVWGIIMYRSLPTKLYSQRGGGSIKERLAAIYELNDEMEQFTLSGSDGASRSDAFLEFARTVDTEFDPRFWKAVFSTIPSKLQPEQLQELLSKLERSEQSDAVSLIDKANKKRDLIEKTLEEVKTYALVRGWLYLHLPLSIGLVVLLVVHILSVFYYW